MELGIDGQCAVGVDGAGEGRAEKVLGGGGHGRDAEGLAIGVRDEVALVVEIGGEVVAGRLGRRIHQLIGAVGAADGGDGVVEVGHRDAGIDLVARVDQDGIGVDVRETEHAGEEGGLVAADAVAVREGHRNRVRLVARRLLLGGQAHVSDVLRDPGEDRAGLLLLVRRARGELGDFVAHLLRNVGERGLAEVPVPAGDRGPVLGGADEDALGAGAEGGHLGLAEGLRHVSRLPRVEGAAVREGDGVRRDGLAKRVAEVRMAEGVGGGGGDVVGVAEDRREMLEEVGAGPDSGDARLEDVLDDDVVDDVADFDAREGDGVALVVRVVDVGHHLHGVHLLA